MFNNLLFISKGLQLAVLVFFVVLVLIFMKMTSYEQKIKDLQNNMVNYITTDEYLESFNNLLDDKLAGKNISPYGPYTPHPPNDPYASRQEVSE